MNPLLRVFCLFALVAAGNIRLQAASTNDFRLTVELRDGSTIIGKSGDEQLHFKSEVLGEMKLPLERIRSIECQADTNLVKLITDKGDTLTARFTSKEIRIEASFGNFKLPVSLIRRAQVSVVGKAGKVRPGMVALWSGEGNGEDALGGNNAVLTDVSFTQGKIGQAFSLNGSSSCMKIPASSSLNVGEKDGFTVSAWIKPNDVDGLHPIVEWSGGGKLGVHLWIGHQPDDMGVLMANISDTGGTGHALLSAPGTVVVNSFQCVVLTYDKGTGSGVLYLNGAVVAQGNWGRFVPETSCDLLISRRILDHPGDTTYNTFFGGTMDEVGIYDRALTAEEIRALCTEGNNGKPLPPPPVRRSPRPGKFRFGDGLSTSL